MDALWVCLYVFAGVTLGTWLASMVTREYSWVDRIWSIVPVAYVGIFAGAAGFADARLDVMFALVALWGARLTFNFARKGGYAPGGEDYRWAVLRERMAPWQFQLFNFFFISLYQNVILLLITLPALTALEHPGGFGVADVVVALAFAAFLVGETVADQQQWAFHREKHAGRAPTRFLQTGLFRYSRHPNFFFEQAQWWAFYALGAVALVADGGSWLNWTIAGAAGLTVLFVGSTIFTESISAAKYPAYRDYQRTTSMLLPLPRRRTRTPETA